MMDDGEPMGMSGALSSSRSDGGGGGGGGKKKKKKDEWRRKDSKKDRKSKEKKGKQVDVTFGGMGSVSAAMSASAYYKDVGKKGLKKRKHVPADHLSSGFDVPLTKEEKKRRKERQVRVPRINSSLCLRLFFLLHNACWLQPTYELTYDWSRTSHFPSQLQMRFQADPTSSAPVEPPAALDAVYAALSHSRDGGRSSFGSTKKKKSKHSGDDLANDFGNGFVGTSQSLEKPYLRLTTFPKAEDVRPLPVLQRALQHIKARYHTEEDFVWANEQLKSVRQDITVQGLRNNLVLEVYETHARLALEEGELNEFNQCQTKIKELTLGTGGGGASSSAGDDDNAVALTPSKTKSKTANKKAMKLLRQDEDVADEFAGYRLLYALVQKNWGDVNKELKVTAAMISAENRRVHQEKERDERMSSCRHAQLVVNALVHCDYHAFFVLYENAPHMSCYLMDFLLNRIRCGAYERITAAFRPSVSVESIRETLKFRDLEETRQFLKSSGAVFVKEKGGVPPFFVDCKASKSNSS